MSQISPTIFRAYDIRGIVNESLTLDTMCMLGMAIGSEALARGEKSIIVARDGRLSGSLLSMILMTGLQASGCNVIDIGSVPTPVLYFATHVLGVSSGVMLTGSHNPPQYNGLKIVLGQETLAEESIQDLYRRIVEQDFTRGVGHLEKREIIDQYIKMVTADIHCHKKIKVVLDCGNGIAGIIAPTLLRALGCEVIELFCTVDGHFPNHHPDPSQPENLKDLINTVKKENADIGIAFDGDGDRLGIVTNRGEIIWPDRQLMLFAKDLLKRKPGANILFDVKCSRHVADVIRAQGGNPVMWKTGHSLIKAKMRESGALLAGEMSGHIFFKERWFGFDDALYAAAKLLEIISEDTRDVSTIFKALPDSINTPELKCEISDDRKFSFIQTLIKQANFSDGIATTIDGLRVDFSDGWGLVRPSNTTPSLVLRFEADNENALKRIQHLFREQLLAVDKQLNLPF